MRLDFPMIMTYKDTENPNFEPYFYFLNGHNDVVYFADSNLSEEKTESYEYNPWGVLLTSASKNNLLYTAREFDFDINLQFNRMRYCKPNLGRFVQKDKIFNSFNGFIYSSNMPINYLDPFGLYGVGIPIMINLLSLKYSDCFDDCAYQCFIDCYSNYIPGFSDICFLLYFTICAVGCAFA